MKNTEMAVALAAATCTNVQQMMVVESVYDLLPTTQLTQHFSLREFIISATAIRHGIDNTPSEETVARLKALCDNVLEPLRRRFGRIHERLPLAKRQCKGGRRGYIATHSGRGSRHQRA